MKRFSPRDLALYLLLLLLTLFAVNTLQQMNRADDPSYSQIRTLFEQEKVKNFSVKDNVLTMTVRATTPPPLPMSCPISMSFTTTCMSSSTSSAPKGSLRTMTIPWACRAPGGISICPTCWSSW